MISKINLKDEVNSLNQLFKYKEICKLNNHMFNVLKAENRTLEFHSHDLSDELFYCIEGEFDIEFTDGKTHLSEGDLIVIPKGVLHRPVCKSLVKCLLIELDGTLNETNTGGTYKSEIELL